MSVRLLSDPLPLRRASAAANFRSAAVQPIVYGRVRLAALPLDAAGLEWLIADHPIVAVERVSVDGKPTDGWQLVQRADPTGQPVALLRLTQAPPRGVAPHVQLIGRRHPDTGAALEHPADIAADLLRLCGWPVDADAFQGLRDDYPGVTLGLVLDAPQRLRDALAQVLDPLGAIWRAAPAVGSLRTPGAPVLRLDEINVDDIRAESSSEPLATRLHVSFAHDWAESLARQTLTLAAPEAEAEYGELAAELELPAVRTARDALAIASRILADRARPGWQVSITLDARAALQPGDAVQLAHPWAPQGAALVLSTALDRERGTLQISAWMPAGDAPQVELLARGQAIDAAVADNAVTFRDGKASFTIADDHGNPLAGAAVTLDKQETRNTDRNGLVQFTTTRGAHTLDVYAPGFAPFTMEVVV